MNIKRQERRKKVIVRLEAQLESGVKNISRKSRERLGLKPDVKSVPLDAKDRERIGKQLEILQSRI